jgi:CheY-like chemotaxis protein
MGVSHRKQFRSRSRLWLVHSKPELAKILKGKLSDAGYSVVRDSGWSSPALSRAKNDPPDAVVVDLSRTPSFGRDVAIAIRSHTAMLRVPLVFVDGKPAAVETLRKLLPDATHTSSASLIKDLRRAIANPPQTASKLSVFAAYANTPLRKKLGLLANYVVALVNPPSGFGETLAEMAAGVRLCADGRGARDLTLWFATARRELERGISKMAPFAAGGRLWIIWPKKTSALSSDLSQVVVRQVGLAHGLVDFKISSIDETWSGLRFTKRK